MRNGFALCVFSIGEEGACGAYRVGDIVKPPSREFLHLKLML